MTDCSVGTPSGCTIWGVGVNATLPIDPTRPPDKELAFFKFNRASVKNPGAVPGFLCTGRYCAACK